MASEGSCGRRVSLAPRDGWERLRALCSSAELGGEVLGGAAGTEDVHPSKFIFHRHQVSYCTTCSIWMAVAVGGLRGADGKELFPPDYLVQSILQLSEFLINGWGGGAA